MSDRQLHDDQMPDRNSPEFDSYAKRLLRLSERDFFDLFEVVGIKFASRHTPDKPASYEELREVPRDMLVDVFDEADSRRKIEEILRAKGV
jgi:hypothetical protein